MQNSFVLGVSVGESFAEYCVLEGSKIVAAKRAYLTRENLKNSLQQFVSLHQDKKISASFVSLRVRERLVDYKVNSSVAHLITEGFEHWLDLQKNSSAMTSKDLLFSVRERILANGQVAIPLDVAELDAVAAKLQMMETKKICLHFLHSSANSAHQDFAKAFFTEKGFDVFTPKASDTPDETLRWRKNALNALASSVFADLQKDIAESLKDAVPADGIHYLSSAGSLYKSGLCNDISGQFSAFVALTALTSQKDTDILYLGLEDFVLISPGQWDRVCKSPWGLLENQQIRFRNLNIQPTQNIELNHFAHFDFVANEGGWEPGPMFLGRGQKATLIDLWSEHAKLGKTEGLSDRAVPAGVQRFKNSLLALSKSSRGNNREVASLTKDLQSLAMQKVVMESLLFRNGKKLLVTGPLAELFANGFKKDSHATVEAEEFAEARSVALYGQKVLKV